MGIFSRFLVVLAAFIAGSASMSGAVQAGGIYDELTDAQKDKIQKGEQVFFTENVAGSEWPRAYVYQRIEATPEESAAVFFDFERHKNFIPNLKKSKISKVIDPRTFEVDYTLKVPTFFLPDEDYTVRNQLSSYDDGASYQIAWKLVRADTTKDSVGNVRFEALGTGTIMGYINFVKPGSSLADMVKGKAMKQVQDTAKAMRRQIETERTKERELLEEQLKALRSALSN